MDQPFSAEPAVDPHLRQVSYAVEKGAVVKATKSKLWIAVQGFENRWHLSIIPIHQESWRKAYQLPASGTRGVTEFMQYDEFHLTTPDLAKHFYYTATCIPLRHSQFGGKSPYWTDADWAQANAVCAWWFRVDQSWLDAYVQAQPKQEEDERKRQREQANREQAIWEEYKEWCKTNPVIDYEEWLRSRT
jgi:hypothetical protein